MPAGFDLYTFDDVMVASPSTATTYVVSGIPSAPVVGTVYTVAVILANGVAGTTLTVTFGALSGITWGGAVTIAATATYGTTTVTFTTAGTYTPTVSHGGGSTISGNPTLSSVTAAAIPYTAASNVRLGTNRGDGTIGTLVVPPVSTVLTTETFDNGTTGTVVLPTAAQVLTTATFGPASATAGIVVLPAAGQVESGIPFGPSSGLMGTYTGAGVPATSYTISGIPSAPVVGVSYTVAVLLNGYASESGVITPTPASGITYGSALSIAANGTGGTITVDFTATGTYTPAFTHTGLGFGGDPTLSAVTTSAGSGGSSVTDSSIQADVAAAMIALGYTGARANKLDALDVAISTRSTFAGGAVAEVLAPVTVGTNNDKVGYALSASGLDPIAVEPGVNARQALSPILAASAGVIGGAGTGAIIIKGGNSSITRIVATTDNAGNRSAITLNLPD